MKTLRAILARSRCRMVSAVILTACTLGMSLVVAGCGGGKEPAITSTSKPQSAPLPSLTPNVAGATAVPGAKSAAAPPPAAIDFASAVRPVNDEGKPSTDLQLLNQAINAYVQGSPDAPFAKGGPQPEPGSVEATVMGTYPPVLKDLSELIKAGVIKSLPVAPPGKAYILDAKTGQAALVDKQ